MSSPAGTDPDFDEIPFYTDMEDVPGDPLYPDSVVSSGDAALYGAGAPYGTASYAASGYDSEELALIYEELQLVNDNLNSLAAIHQEGYGMHAVFMGLTAGMLLMLGLWLGGCR